MGYLTVPRSLQLVLSLVLLTTCAACAGPGPPAKRSHAPEVSASALDLNTASEKQLRLLPGVGPVTAGKIVAYRNKNGRFARVEHLLLVDGISESKFRKLRRYVTVR